MLTKTEIKIMSRLAKAYSIDHLCADLQMTRTCLYTHLTNIRKKTRIPNIRRPDRARQWMEEHPEMIGRAALPSVPTDTQLRCMKLFALGDDKHSIAKLLNIGPETASNHITNGCHRAGIRKLFGVSRRKQIDDYLTQHDPQWPTRDTAAPSMADPMFQ